MTGGANPAPERQFARQLSQVQARLHALETRDVLQNATIGLNGLTVTDGGSITITGTGTLSVASGGLNSAGSISATTTITAGGTITANGGLIGVSLGIVGGTTIDGSGNATFPGLITSTGTKAHTVTVGYSAVYIDSSGIMGGNTSSRRFKTHIAPAELDLDGILAVPEVTFQRKAAIEALGSWEAAPWHVGYLAEDMEKVAPWAVWHDDEGRVEGIRYEELVVAALALNKRQAAQIAELQAAVKALQAQSQ